MLDDNAILMKVPVLGAATNVGTTNLIRQFANNEFTDKYKATYGVAFANKMVEHENTEVKMQLWDIAGDTAGHILPTYLKETKAVVLVFDITKRASFEALKGKLTEIRKILGGFFDEEIPITLVGTKCDLEVKREVTTEEAKQFAKENDLVGFFETSAKENINVDEMFESIAIAHVKKLPEKVAQEEIEEIEEEEEEEGAALSEEGAGLTNEKVVNTYLKDLDKAITPELCLKLFNTLMDVIKSADEGSFYHNLYHRESTSLKTQVWPNEQGQLDNVTERFNYIVRVTRLTILKHCCEKENIKVNANVKNFLNKQTKAPGGSTFFGKLHTSEESRLFAKLEKTKGFSSKDFSNLKKKVDTLLKEKIEHLEDRAENRDEEIAKAKKDTSSSSLSSSSLSSSVNPIVVVML